MSPVPDIWLLRSDGERGESIEGTASKPILVWKFPKKNLRLWEETANPWLSCSAWLSLALSISPGGWAGEALASPGRREGWRMSWAGCHCEGRRTERRLTGSNTATSGPPVCSRAGPAYSGALLSSNSPLTLCCPSQSQAGPDSCRLPDWPDCVARCGVVWWWWLVRPGPGPGPTSPHRSPDLSNVRRLIRWVSFWLESLGAKWDKIKKLKYWHRPV